MFVFQFATLTVDKVKELVGSHCPDAVAKAILESENPQEKIKQVKKALAIIAEESGGFKLKEWYAKVSNAELVLAQLNNKDMAKLFIDFTDEFVEIAKACIFATYETFSALRDNNLMRLFREHSKNFVDIAKSARVYASSAFGVLGNSKIAKQFEKDSDGIANALISIGKSKEAFVVIGQEGGIIGDLFLSHMEKIVEIIKITKDRGNGAFLLQFRIPQKNIERFLSETNFQKAKQLMQKLKIKDPTGEEVINFAYGMVMFGTEKVVKLYNNFGIEYFMRHSDKIIDEMCARIDEKYTSEKPVLLIAYNKDDWNGAFYLNNTKVEELTRYYRIVLIEMSTEDEFYNQVANVARDYGQIDTVVIGGHGKPDGILLDRRYDEKGQLDLTDKKELRKLRKYFVDEPTVILDACSTGAKGDSMGEMISEVWNAHLFAPEIEASIKEYTLQDDGKILGVEYTVVSSEYLKWIPHKKSDED